MNIALCDDMVSETDIIAEYIDQYFNDIAVHIHKFNDGNILLENHEAQKYDLIFLDVLMPAINGFDIAARIREYDKNTPIVFITFSEEFAIKGYRVMAFDYILKPVKQSDLNNCLGRFMITRNNDGYIIINYKGVDTKIRLSNIQYIESNLHKILFHMHSAQTIEIRSKLDFYEGKLSDSFIRCHKSFIVNLAYVEGIDSRGFVMKEGEIVKISRPYLNESKEAYYSYLFR